MALSLLVSAPACYEDQKEVSEIALSSFIPGINNVDGVYCCYQTKPDFYQISPKKIKALIENLRFAGYKQGFSCMCDAEIVFYLYDNSNLVSVIGIHPDQSIRKYKSTWPGDAVLSENSKGYLAKWLKNNFVDLEVLSRGEFTPPDLE